MSIELRLSDVDPPETEPKRTIYRDIVNLPSTVQLGITARYFNHDDVGLYFQITGSGTGYSFGTVNLGLLATGANAYQNLDNFGSRTKPSSGDLTEGELEENITLTLKAYTDSGYSNLKWTYDRTVTIHWINSADASFTVDELDNFDDGTVEGWGVYISNGGTPAIAAATDYVLSAMYSCKITHEDGYSANNLGFYKQFTTPNRDKVFAIIDTRLGGAAGIYYGSLRVYRDSVLLVFLGKYTDYATVGTTNHVPRDKWLRIVVPLPKNTTLTIKIYSTERCTGGQAMMWLDDFKIISK